MIVVDPGHEYLLDALDGGDPIRLTFVKREGPGYPGNEGSHPGTNMQEVLRALIDRCTYLNNQEPCVETEAVKAQLQIDLLLLELRAARRHGRVLDIWGLSFIHGRVVCEKCGHIGCEGECHV